MRRRWADALKLWAWALAVGVGIYFHGSMPRLLGALFVVWGWFAVVVLAGFGMARLFGEIGEGQNAPPGNEGKRRER